MKDSVVRLGVLAQPHRVGAAIQAHELCRQLQPTRVLLTDLSELHAINSRNAKRVSLVDWFDGYYHKKVKGIPDEQSCRWLLSNIDVLYVVETPLNWEIFRWAKEMNVKTVLNYNYEFLEYFQRAVPKPDLLLAPSKWNIGSVRQFGKVKYLPVPIATDKIRKREITQARTFLHVVGHKAHKDRNGTEIVRESIRYVKNKNIQIKIHDQSKQELQEYADLYNEGDVLLMPRRYGGLCLTIQEAAAAGMPSIVGEHDPYAQEPCTVTIPSNKHEQLKLKANVDSYHCSPRELARMIDNLSSGSIEQLSEKAYSWAKKRSWENMAAQYRKTFEGLYER